MLNGYVEVPRKLWPLIRAQTHVRYVTGEGLFRSGGYVWINPYALTLRDSSTPIQTMKLRNGFNKMAKGYYEWTVSYDDTKELYMKPDPTAMMVQGAMEDVVPKINENLKKLGAFVVKLEKRLAVLEARAGIAPPPKPVKLSEREVAADS